MNLVAQLDPVTARITFHDLDHNEVKVGFVEERGPIWLATVGQDDPATAWEKTFDCWAKACSAVCVELARRCDEKGSAA